MAKLRILEGLKTEERALSPPSNWSRYYGDTSENVTEQAAMTISAVWRAVSLLTSAVGVTPLSFYQREGDNKTRDTSNPLHKLLHDTPNPQQTPYVFKEFLQLSILLCGNGYAEIERDNSDQPIALWPMSPGNVKPEIEGDAIVYKVTAPGFKPAKLPARNVLHIPGLGFDGIQGVSVVTFARRSLALTLGLESYGASTVKNQAVPGGVLTVQGTLDTPAKRQLEEDWQGMYGGLSGRARIAVLEEGTSFNPLSFSPEDTQYLASRQFQITEIARWFNIPPHMLYDLERSTNNNIEHQGLEFNKFSLLPWFVRWEQECTRKVAKSPGFYEFNPAALLRGDLLTRYQALHIARMDGIVSADEWRAMENLGPIPGGNTYLVPMNMSPSAGEKVNGN